MHLKFKKNIKIRTDSLVVIAFCLIVIGFASAYPLKVYTIDPDLSVFSYFVSTSLFFIYLSSLSHQHVKAPTPDVIFLLLASLLPFSYFLNFVESPDSLSIKGNMRKFISYYALLLLVFYIKWRVDYIPRKKFLNHFFLGIALLYFSSVILNSILWRLPESALADLNFKYVVGPFLRAGAGYMDPNFLASFSLILMILTSVFCTEPKKKALCIIFLVMTAFFTYSRAGQILTLVVATFLFGRAIKFNFLSISMALGVSIGIISILIVNGDLLLRRFIDEEGSSSTESRLYQYESFFNFMTDSSTLGNILYGYGGQEYFYGLFRVHLHNFFFSSVMEIGWLFSLLYIVLIAYFFRYCKLMASKLVYIVTLSIMLILPTSPEPFFFMFVCVIFMEMVPKKFQVGVHEK